MRPRLLFLTLLLVLLLPVANASAATGTDKDGDDRIVLSGTVLVNHDETAGDVVVFDGDVTIRGNVKGDVVVFDGDVAIRGRVSGDVVVFSGQASVGQAGRIAGDLVYGGDKPVQAPGSQVAGDVEKVNFGDIGLIGGIGLWIGFTLSLLLLGLVLLLIAPRAGEAVARTAKAKPLIAGLVGLLALFLLPIVAILACVTVVGLPLGIVLLLLIVPLYATAYLAGALVVGRLILKKARILAFVVGLVILQLVGLIPIVGGLIGFLATIVGLGALLLALMSARS